MCGIVTVIRKDGRPAYKAVLKRYRAQKHRGTEGFGYVAIKDNQVVSYKRAPTEHEIVSLMAKEDAPEIWFHHRNPTSAPNIEETAHPILVEHESLDHQYFVMHNGVIRNHKDLKKKHEELGIKYTTEIAKAFISSQSQKTYLIDTDWNDSEALAIEVALTLDGKQSVIGTRGPAAVVGLQTKGRHVERRFFFRNLGNPLHYHEDKTMITLTSRNTGDEVAPSFVKEVHTSGGHQDHPKKILTPIAYEPYTPAVTRYTQPALPASTNNQRRSAGFHRDDDEAIAEHIGRHLNWRADGGVRSIDELLADSWSIFQKKSADSEYSTIVKAYTTALLWEEWNSATALKDEIEVYLRWLDNMADGGLPLPVEMNTKSMLLEGRVRWVEDYAKAIDHELMEREAVVT